MREKTNFIRIVIVFVVYSCLLMAPKFASAHCY